MEIGSGPCKPETYIADCREAIAESLHLSDYLKHGHIDFIVRIDPQAGGRLKDKADCDNELNQLMSAIEQLSGNVNVGVEDLMFYCTVTLTLDNYLEFFGVIHRVSEIVRIVILSDGSYNRVAYDKGIAERSLTKA